MNEVHLLLLIIFILIILQSIVGVGVLVIGTPVLLILNFDLIKIMSMLLPISIMTSLLNLTYFKIYKKKLKIKIKKNLKPLFISICLPSIIVGLVLLKELNQIINIKYLVCFVIIASFIIVNTKNYFLKENYKFKSFFLFLTGIIHGMTNSGGSLLSLFFTYSMDKNMSRYHITYFYFFLALFQYIIYIIVFGLETFFLSYNQLIFILIPGVILGNIVVKYINYDVFKKIVSFLSLISCIVLLINKN